MRPGDSPNSLSSTTQTTMGRALIVGKVKWKKMRRLRMREGWRTKLKLMHWTSARMYEAYVRWKLFARERKKEKDDLESSFLESFSRLDGTKSIIERCALGRLDTVSRILHSSIYYHKFIIKLLFVVTLVSLLIEFVINENNYERKKFVTKLAKSMNYIWLARFS